VKPFRTQLAIVALFSSVVGSACSELLEVDLPARVPSSALEDPARANLLVQSAIADFECAYSNYVDGTAMITDEMYTSGLGTTAEWDRRALNASNETWAAVCGAQSIGPYFIAIYTPLSIARFTADNALHRIDKYPDAEVPG
jgi:hypothetical protein